MTDWKLIETLTEDGFYLVHENGATRAMLRINGKWESTSVALDEWGDISDRIKVRETGVHEPTHWMEIPDGPTLSKDKRDG